jgi:hypothetical protein
MSNQDCHRPHQYSHTMQVGIGQLEALQLGVGSELSSQKKYLMLLQEGLVYCRTDLRVDFGNGKLFHQHM